MSDFWIFQLIFVRLFLWSVWSTDIALQSIVLSRQRFMLRRLFTASAFALDCQCAEKHDNDARVSEDNFCHSSICWDYPKSGCISRFWRNQTTHEGISCQGRIPILSQESKSQLVYRPIELDWYFCKDRSTPVFIRSIRDPKEWRVRRKLEGRGLHRVSDLDFIPKT